MKAEGFIRIKSCHCAKCGVRSKQFREPAHWRHVSPIDLTFIPHKEIQFHVVKPMLQLRSFWVGVGDHSETVDVAIAKLKHVIGFRPKRITIVN